MRTLNISVTEEQSKIVDRLVKEQGFANRSEFFRAVIRVIRRNPAPLNDLAFEQPLTRDVSSIMRDFKNSGRYNDQFLKSLESGLRKSSYFKAR